MPPGTTQPDRFLFDRGTKQLENKKWLTAREFFKQVTETYTQSPLRPDAKLGIGDTYLGEGSPEALVLAIAEFQEFLSFYPTHPRADYAQYKLGMAHFRQMRSPQRDQTETRDAIREFETFLVRYPEQRADAEVRKSPARSQDRLSDVGVRGRAASTTGSAGIRARSIGSARSAEGRSRFTGRDGAYFYLGESLMKAEPPGRGAAALREAGARVRAERAPRRGAEADRRR